MCVSASRAHTNALYPNMLFTAAFAAAVTAATIHSITFNYLHLNNYDLVSENMLQF